MAMRHINKLLRLGHNERLGAMNSTAFLRVVWEMSGAAFTMDVEGQGAVDGDVFAGLALFERLFTTLAITHIISFKGCKRHTLIEQSFAIRDGAAAAH